MNIFSRLFGGNNNGCYCGGCFSCTVCENYFACPSINILESALPIARANFTFPQ